MSCIAPGEAITETHGSCVFQAVSPRYSHVLHMCGQQQSCPGRCSLYLAQIWVEIIVNLARNSRVWT